MKKNFVNVSETEKWRWEYDVNSNVHHTYYSTIVPLYVCNTCELSWTTLSSSDTPSQQSEHVIMQCEEYDTRYLYI